MSRTFRWVLVVFMAACICVPATAFASPGPPDSPQSDATLESGDLAAESEDDGTALESSSPLQEDNQQTALEAYENEEAGNTTATPSQSNSQQSDSADLEAATAPAVSAAANAPRAPERQSAIYVNGDSGDDANPGTESAPVKTFARAKQLLESSGGDIIYVTSALRVTDDAGTWELGGKTLARGNDYHGDLIGVLRGGVLTLKDIVIDGRSGDGQTGVATSAWGDGGSLVAVHGGVLTIAEGAILQNNSVESRGNWYPEGGGAVFVNGGTVNVEGGTIRNNEAVQGGGIYAIYGAVVNMSSGTITGNRAIEGASKTLPSDYGGNGGGICATNGSRVNFSGGTITGNSAFERGGGISVGAYYASEMSNPILTMTGGTVTGNTAGSAGGGIFVQAGYSASANGGTPTYAIAYITGGGITDNAMTGTGRGNKTFGGGGIYVNGYSSVYSNFHNGELYLANLEVSNNYAATAGGGYAACPVSLTEISLTNGAAFYGNTTDAGNARELYIMASLAYGTHSGDPVYEISPSMLGGGAYRWVNDNGEEVPLDRLKGILRAFWNETLSLSNDLSASDPGVQKALGLVKVRITGNTSTTRGGGIGSNGSVFIGKSVDTTEISLSKTWDDANDKDGIRPATIKVNLYRDGEYVGYQTMRPDSDGNWSMTFENLPKNDASGHVYTYTVEEREVTGYTATIDGDAVNGYSVINTLSVSISGIKVWVDANNQDGMRPLAITVNLLRDGLIRDTKIVTADDNWSFLFDGLAKYDEDGNEYVYTIAEEAVEGYTSKLEGDAVNGFTITNTKNDIPEKPNKPDKPVKPSPNEPTKSITPSNPTTPTQQMPATGDDMTFPVVLAVIAFACIVIALTARRKLTLAKESSTAVDLHSDGDHPMK